MDPRRPPLSPVDRAGRAVWAARRGDAVQRPGGRPHLGPGPRRRRETLDDLEAGIRQSSPGLVIVDTVGMTTQRQPRRPRGGAGVLRTLDGDRRRLAGLVPAADAPEPRGAALGRRIVGAARVVWKLTRPTPRASPTAASSGWTRRMASSRSPWACPSPRRAAASTTGRRPPRRRRGDVRRNARRNVSNGWRSGWRRGRSSIREIRDEAKGRGFSLGLMYTVQRELEAREVSRQGKKYWALPDDEDDPPPASFF